MREEDAKKWLEEGLCRAFIDRGAITAAEQAEFIEIYRTVIQTLEKGELFKWTCYQAALAIVFSCPDPDVFVNEAVSDEPPVPLHLPKVAIAIMEVLFNQSYPKFEDMDCALRSFFIFVFTQGLSRILEHTAPGGDQNEFISTVADRVVAATSLGKQKF